MNINPIIRVDQLYGHEILLGVFTTFNANSVTFDFAPMVKQHGAGLFAVSFLRPGETTPYRVANLETNGTLATWTFSATDTEKPGKGKAFLSYIVGNKVFDMSEDIPCKIAKNSAPTGETPPDPLESWYQQMLEAVTQAQTAAEGAGASAANAGASAANAGASETAAAQSAAEASGTASSFAALLGTTTRAALLPRGRMRGDANGDGVIDNGDAQHILGIIDRSVPRPADGTEDYAACDVNGDGDIDISDAGEVLSIISGRIKIGSYPEITGAWASNPNHETEDAQFYCDIAYPDAVPGLAAYLTGDDWCTANVERCECLTGAVRVYVKLVPIEPKNVVLSVGITGAGLVQAAQTAKADAEQKADDAADSATSAESWAVGGTGTRTGEDADNARYYAGQAETAASKAETAAGNQPVIGKNGHWWVYDASIEDYRDTGYPARGTQGETGPQGPQGDDYVLTQADKEEIADMVSGMFVVQVSGTTPTITAEANHRYVCEEVATLDFTPPASGICDVVFTSGATATVLNLPSTVKMPDWFDTTTLEAGTTYEISIADGYGAVMSWEV